MKTLTNFAANGSKVIATVRKANTANAYYLATTLIYGTFGAGTLTLYLSPDGGTTLIPLPVSPGGAASSYTTNGVLQSQLGNPDKNTDTLQIWATLAGATAPNLNVAHYDNNG